MDTGPTYGCGRSEETAGKAIAGAKVVSQVRENAATGQITIPQAEMAEIDATLAQRD